MSVIIHSGVIFPTSGYCEYITTDSIDMSLCDVRVSTFDVWVLTIGVVAAIT